MSCTTVSISRHHRHSAPDASRRPQHHDRKGPRARSCIGSLRSEVTVGPVSHGGAGLSRALCVPFVGQLAYRRSGLVLETWAATQLEDLEDFVRSLSCNILVSGRSADDALMHSV